MHWHWIGRELRPFILARIELPEDPHRIASGILTAVDKNLAIDLGADDFIGALRNRRAGAPFALGVGGRCRSQRKCEEQRRSPRSSKNGSSRFPPLMSAAVSAVERSIPFLSVQHPSRHYPAREPAERMGRPKREQSA